MQVTKFFLNDVIVCAVEGGIGYWSQVRDYRWEKDDDWNITEASATVVPFDDPKVYKLTWETVEDGIRKVLAGTVKVHSSYVGSIAVAAAEGDAGEIDAELADIIVQAGLFGEVIYG